MKLALKLIAAATLAATLSGCIIYADSGSSVTHTEKHETNKTTK
ncbi:hypothetical protein PQU92_01535 [Asticcacaulis sp. BYS171W]|uniref:Lipoprotein n=1 Tax=Asticcacaulis aquaticus TaxID=2984212 RepID=A0ABT5HPM6_9CAUL|nr:hypothetical protein [Asticcacaulis aquaticus]MDC7681939.1 hypothetical protein [Asticcacaulis aquaticus]